jgi:hypothetical protein
MTIVKGVKVIAKWIVRAVEATLLAKQVINATFTGLLLPPENVEYTLELLLEGRR